MPTLITQANVDVRHWCLTTAGQRVHRTPKEPPLERFEAVERAQLKPLPTMSYDLAVWKRVKRHRECYVVFEQAFYSAPFRLIGQPLWVRGGAAKRYASIPRAMSWWPRTCAPRVPARG